MSCPDIADLFELRRRFLANQYTIKNVQRDFHEWHRGRSRYVLWAIDVDVPVVRQRLAIANQHLAKFLLQGYARQPHITLGISGFLNHESQYADDYASSSFERDLAALRAAHIQPFEIEIGALASFSSAPFFHVQDFNGSLHRLHGCLHSVASDKNFQYVPHITAGLYADAWPTDMVSDHLDTFPTPCKTGFMVNQISLMSYAASEIGGKLTKIADYDLEHAQVSWHEPSPFNLSVG